MINRIHKGLVDYTDHEDEYRYEGTSEGLREYAKYLEQIWSSKLSNRKIKEIFGNETRINLGSEFELNKEEILEAKKELKNKYQRQFKGTMNFFKANNYVVISKDSFPIETASDLSNIKSLDLRTFLTDVAFQDIDSYEAVVSSATPHYWDGETVYSRGPLEYKDAFRNGQRPRKVLSEAQRKFECFDDYERALGILTMYEQELSVITQRSRINTDVYLSIDPLDFLFMGTHTNGWSSCFCLYSGDYAASSIGELGNPESVLLVTYGSGKAEGGRRKITNRATVYINDDGFFVNDCYPNNNSPVMAIGRDFLLSQYENPKAATCDIEGTYDKYQDNPGAQMGYGVIDEVYFPSSGNTTYLLDPYGGVGGEVIDIDDAVGLKIVCFKDDEDRCVWCDEIFNLDSLNELGECEYCE